MSRPTFTQYVHEFTNDNGQTRYAVGEYDADRAQFTRPFDATERKLTGCHAEFARHPDGIQNYSSRNRALRRARYLYR